MSLHLNNILCFSCDNIILWKTTTFVCILENLFVFVQKLYTCIYTLYNILISHLYISLDFELFNVWIVFEFRIECGTNLPINKGIAWFGVRKCHRKSYETEFLFRSTTVNVRLYYIALMIHMLVIYNTSYVWR